jgi:hypothetical protein
MSYTVGEPISPKRKSMTTYVLVAFLVVVVLFIGNMMGTTEFDYDDLDNTSVPASTLLKPGFHFLAKWPFVETIPINRVGTVLDMGWYYSIKTYPPTDIPIGYVGVLTNKTTGIVEPNPLKPGRYYLNHDYYKVDKIYTEKQTWHFGESKEGDD